MLSELWYLGSMETNGTPRLSGREREDAKNRLAIIASLLDACFRAELELSDRIQRLRSEQAELNTKVYRS